MNKPFLPKVTFADPHPILDGFDSLNRHHWAKAEIRIDQLRQIPVPSNARILDIGCGPGLYLKKWLELTVEQQAHFVLVDHSADALKQCESIAAASGDLHRITTVAIDFQELRTSRIGQFDVAFIGNTLQYFDNPTSWLRETVTPLLRERGILAVRDLDCGILGCNLFDPLLVAKVVAARIAGCQQIAREGQFHNPFLGRDLQRILKSAGLESVRLLPYHVEFKAPLTEAQKSYLSKLHTTWYVEDVTGILTDDEKRYWTKAFDLENPDSVLNSDSFYYTEAEFLAIGTLPGQPS